MGCLLWHEWIYSNQQKYIGQRTENKNIYFSERKCLKCEREEYLASVQGWSHNWVRTK